MSQPIPNASLCPWAELVIRGRTSKDGASHVTRATLRTVRVGGAKAAPTDPHAQPLRWLTDRFVIGMVVSEAPDLSDHNLHATIDLAGLDTSYYLRNGWLQLAGADGPAAVLGYPTGIFLVEAGATPPGLDDDAALPVRSLWAVFYLFPGKADALFAAMQVDDQPRRPLFSRLIETSLRPDYVEIKLSPYRHPDSEVLINVLNHWSSDDRNTASMSMDKAEQVAEALLQAVALRRALTVPSVPRSPANLVKE